MLDACLLQVQAFLSLPVHLEVDDERKVVGKLHIRHPEFIDLDFGAVQNEIQMFLRVVAGERGLHVLVGILQATRGHKQVNFLFPHKGIKIAREDIGACRFLDEMIEMKNLLLPCLVAECKMNEEKGDVLQLQLDNELFHTPLEVVKRFVMDRVLGQKGVALIFVNGDALPTRGNTVFGTIAVEMPEFFRHLFGLALFTGAVGAVIDLDQPDHIGIERPNKLRDFIQVIMGAPQHSKERKLTLVSMRGVANIV